MDYKELEKFIKQLFNGYLNKYKLSVDDKNDVIQDSLLQIWRKEQDGTLVGDIENNKNYIFITVRNFVYAKVEKVIKNNNHVKIEDYMDIPITDKNIFDLTDIQFKKDLIISLMKDKSFTDLERRIIHYLFNGYHIGEIKKIEKNNTTKHGVKNAYSNLKIKLKIRFNHIIEPNYKYNLILPNGQQIKFIKQKELCKFIKMNESTFGYWKKRGRTIFPNFKIHYLS